MVFFILKKTLSAIVLPPNGPLLLALLGLLMLRRRPRVGRSFAWLGVLTLLALSTPVVAVALERIVNDGPPLDLTKASSAKAIVILGGGLDLEAPEYGGDTVNRSTLERVRYGALIAHKSGLPVLVTAGAAFANGIPGAIGMKQTLETEFGVKVRWAETRSRDTHENAHFSAKILRGVGITDVILVTHSIHMPRSEAEFRAAGLRVFPAPTVMPHLTVDTMLDLVPCAGSLERSSSALHEILGSAAFRAMM